MKLAIQVQVEQLPEGVFLAASDQLPGLVAQGRTVAEALDIARRSAKPHGGAPGARRFGPPVRAAMTVLAP